MIPVHLPWLIVSWIDDESGLRVECLGCEWCASILDTCRREDLDDFFDRLKAEHAGCNPDERPLRLIRFLTDLPGLGYNDPGE